MKRLYVLITAAALCSPAMAEKAIYTGGEAGAYHKTFCPPITPALAEGLFQGYNCKTSAGTGDNIKQVLASPNAIGFAQLDVLAREMTQTADLAKKITIIRQDIACEGLWMVTKNPRLQNYGDVLGLARRIPFVLPPAASGSVASFTYLQSIDPEGLGRAGNIRNVESAEAVIKQVAAASDGSVGFFVQWADPRNGNIKLIAEKDLRLIPVVSNEIVRVKVDGQELYQVQDFSLTEGGYIASGKKATTACTPVALITGNPEAMNGRNAMDDQKDLIKIVREIPTAKLLPSEGYLAAILRNARRVSGKALTDLTEGVEAARRAMEKASQ